MSALRGEDADAAGVVGGREAAGLVLAVLVLAPLPCLCGPSTQRSLPREPLASYWSISSIPFA